MSAFPVVRLSLAAGSLAVILALGGCVSEPTTSALGDPPVAGEGWADETTGSAAGQASCELIREGSGLLPDPDCTPGAVTSEISPADTSPVCASKEEGEVRDNVRAAILAAYGIDDAESDDYVVDYLVPRQLGGANDYANLWPIPVKDPAANAKSATEATVIDAVCGKRAGIQAAQYAFASDWTSAMKSLGLAG